MSQRPRGWEKHGDPHEPLTAALTLSHWGVPSAQLLPGSEKAHALSKGLISCLCYKLEML